MNAKGEVLEALDEVAFRKMMAEVEGIESVAVCFLHSYANPIHEQRVVEIASECRPDLYVTASSEVAPIIREYERFMATVINAYVAPRIAGYIGDMLSALSERGFTGSVSIMKSDGGMCSPEEARQYPVRSLESGPAAGILSAADTASKCEAGLSIALDMGGTTAKACLISGGQPALADEIEVDRLKRFTKGSGLPLRLPSLDLIEIGAGGGSIGWIDSLGIMQVGPESAGAEPGAACYGTGGQFPTVTDADLLLGYLDPAYFAAGTMRLDVDLAAEAVSRHILKPTGTSDVTVAAWGIHEIVNENMARATRLHGVEHGVDPAAVTLIVTGGAGPVHASGLLRTIGARRVICPPSAEVASALGLMLAPRTTELRVTELMPLEELSDDGLHARLRQLEAGLREKAGEPSPSFSVNAWVHMRLHGQGYEVRVPVESPHSIEGLSRAFDREYEARFGRAPWTADREIVDWLLRLSSPKPALPSRLAAVGGDISPGTTRRAFFGPTHGWLETPVRTRTHVHAAGTSEGPMLIREEGTTVVVAPGFTVFSDDLGNIYIEATQDGVRPPSRTLANDLVGVRNLG
jgi:N-methylhydantoinase A